MTARNESSTIIDFEERFDSVLNPFELTAAYLQLLEEYGPDAELHDLGETFVRRMEAASYDDPAEQEEQYRALLTTLRDAMRLKGIDMSARSVLEARDRNYQSLLWPDGETLSDPTQQPLPEDRNTTTRAMIDGMVQNFLDLGYGPEKARQEVIHWLRGEKALMQRIRDRIHTPRGQSVGETLR